MLKQNNVWLIYMINTFEKAQKSTQIKYENIKIKAYSKY